MCSADIIKTHRKKIVSMVDKQEKWLKIFKELK